MTRIEKGCRKTTEKYITNFSIVL